VQALIAELLDMSEFQRGQVGAFQGERAGELDSAVMLATSPSSFGLVTTGRPGGASLTSILLGPSFKLSGVRCSQSTSDWVSHAADPAYTAANLPRTSRVEARMAGITRFSRMVESLLMPSLNRAYETHFRAVVERRVAATQLAIRLYQIDYNEAFPATLAELVPTYLPAVPTDPFTGDQQPIKYVREGINEGIATPLLYSVGQNGVDDHASTRNTRSIVRPAYNTWEMEDAVFPLIPPPPKEPEKAESPYGTMDEPATAPTTAPAVE